MLTVLDLFAGIGGFSLGLERTGGFKTVAFCEIDPFARRVLANHWPEVPCYEDVRTLDASRLDADRIGRIDIICGGFPCQPFSSASRGRRVATDLWPEMERIIGDIRPRYVIAENVQERPIRDGVRSLARWGYSSFYRRLGADDAGADHTRNRWWACAYTDDESELHRAFNAEVAMLPALCRGLWGATNYARAVRISDGVSHRMDRLRALGNTVLPFIPECFGRAILAAEASRTSLVAAE
jgi:DNA (cytosine-5)-methyltransferase 1